jgi:hypothetical protein
MTRKPVLLLGFTCACLLKLTQAGLPAEAMAKAGRIYHVFSVTLVLKELYSTVTLYKCHTFYRDQYPRRKRHYLRCASRRRIFAKEIGVHFI